MLPSLAVCRGSSTAACRTQARTVLAGERAAHPLYPAAFRLSRTRDEVQSTGLSFYREVGGAWPH